MKNPLFAAFFLVSFYAVLTFLHWFFWRWLTASFPLSTHLRRAILVFFGVMYLFPLANHLCAASGGTFAIRGITWIGYLWFALLFYYLFIGGLWEIVAIVIERGAHITLPRRPFFIITLILCTAIIVYGFFEASHIRVRHVTTVSSKLPSFVSKVRIVHVSDTHFTHLNGLGFARKVTDLVKEQHPDLVVHTGDFLDRGFIDEEAIAALWKEIPTPLGKYAVTGNHEFYNGILATSTELERSGFMLLRNRAEIRGNVIAIVGVDDPTAELFGEPLPDPATVLGTAPRNMFVLFLRHQPKDDPSVRGLFDLQLTGHTHNGQLWPFSLFVSLAYPMRGGVYKQEDGSTIVVSSGAGTWGPPIRVLAPPDIVVIDVVRQVP